MTLVDWMIIIFGILLGLAATIAWAWNDYRKFWGKWPHDDNGKPK